LDKQLGVLNAAKVPKKRESPLSIHYKLLGSHHVPDIVGTSSAAATAGMMTRKEIVVALKDTVAIWKVERSCLKE
jgi:hypothetical protein